MMEQAMRERTGSLIMEHILLQIIFFGKFLDMISFGYASLGFG